LGPISGSHQGQRPNGREEVGDRTVEQRRASRSPSDHSCRFLTEPKGTLRMCCRAPLWCCVRGAPRKESRLQLLPRGWSRRLSIRRLPAHSKLVRVAIPPGPVCQLPLRRRHGAFRAIEQGGAPPDRGVAAADRSEHDCVPHQAVALMLRGVPRGTSGHGASELYVRCILLPT
jgi:hypothetical protein